MPRATGVLTLIAEALGAALRANDRLYRLGGDEFAAFLARTTPARPSRSPSAASA